MENERDKKWDSIYGRYFDNDAPIWYRGYFSDEFKKEDIKKMF